MLPKMDMAASFDSHPKWVGALGKGPGSHAPIPEVRLAGEP